MAAVDASGWFGNLFDLATAPQDFKFWCIEKNEIYIKLSPGDQVLCEWKLWATNVTSDPPTRVYDSTPFIVYPPYQK